MITREEALDLFRSDDLIGIGMEADAVRRKWHPEGIVTYIIDRNINYTNFCTEYCTFCAFYRPMGHAEGYILSKQVIFDKIQETIDLGGTGVLMQGGLHPDLKIEWYEDLFRSIKQRFAIHLHCLSAPEVTNIAEVSGLSLRDTIARLRDAGLDSIPGGGAEILDDDVRQRISRLKCNVQEWVDVHRTAHQLGMRTTATMMFGCGETFEQRMNHLELVRNLQEPPQSVNFALMIHKIHTGENGNGYTIVGFGGSHNDFSDVRYPTMSPTGATGDTAKCDMCHVNNSETVFPEGLNNVLDTQGLLSPVPATTSACTACHQTKSALAHAVSQTDPKFGESCDVCHASGAAFDVQQVHAGK